MVGCSELTPDPGSTGRNTELSIFNNVQTQLNRDCNGEEQRQEGGMHRHHKLQGLG